MGLLEGKPAGAGVSGMPAMASTGGASADAGGGGAAGAGATATHVDEVARALAAMPTFP